MMLMLTIILISSAITEEVYAIQCHKCESVSEPNCGEDFEMEEHFKVDCDQIASPRYLSNDIEYFNATACMKKIYKEHRVVKYVRSCYFGEFNETKIGCRMDPALVDIQDVQCFICDDKNFCNKAKIMNGNVCLLLVLLIFKFMANSLIN